MDVTRYTFLFCILFLLQVKTIKMVLFTDMQSLYNTLTTGGNKYLRPQVDYDTPTHISMSLTLLNLQEINAVDGTVSVAAYFTVIWKDENLMWKPSDYNNTQVITLPYDKIWHPPLINKNGAGKMEVFGKDNTYLQLYNNGYVVWLPGEDITFLCDINTSYFPMDTQICYLQIISWGFPDGNITFQAMDNVIHLALYTTNNEWDLIETSVSVDNRYVPMINFGMTFKRKPVFLLITLVLPAIFMALLNICVFFLPQESGERIGFSVTLLLAVVVFLTIAQGLLPATATPRLSSMCIIMMLDLVMSGMIVVSVIISSRLYYKPENELVPDWIQWLLCLNLECRKFRITPNQVSVYEKEKGEKREHDSQNNKGENKDKVNWKKVSSFWDHISVLFCFVVFVVGNLFFFVDVTTSA